MHSTFAKTSATVAATLLAGVAGCEKKQQAGPPGGGMPPPTVVVAEARAKDVPQYLDEIGKAAAVASVTITPRVSGAIVERHFEDGADLKKGQLLFVIDKRPYEATLATAKAAVAQTKASSQFAKIELDRYSAVAGTKAISKSDFDTKRNAVDVAEAQVAAAEAQVRSAEINVEYCTITSPLDGRAGARMVDVGNVVKENEASLLSIQQIKPIYADFTVNESELAAVQANMATGTLSAFVRLPTDAEDKGREGPLTFLDNSVQDATGTVKLRVTLQNDDLHFWPGQFVNVRLVLKTLKDAVLIPTSAQQLSQKGPFVFVVKSDSTAEIRPIVMGQMQGSDTVITNGLAVGEKVITDGQMMVRPGGKVSVQGSPPQISNANGTNVQPGTPDAKETSAQQPTQGTPNEATPGTGSPSGGNAGSGPGSGQSHPSDQKDANSSDKGAKGN